VDGEGVEVPHPFRIAAARDVAYERREDVPVAQHEIPGLQGRKDVALVPVREVGGVKQRKGARRQQIPLLPSTYDVADKLGRVPLGEERAVSPEREPLPEELRLRRLAAPVEPF